MKSLVRTISAGLLATVLSGCGLWGDSGEEVEPNPLVSFEAEKEVDVLWSVSVGSGPGSKYHQFQPAIDGDKIFAADRDGSVFGYALASGEKLWETELELPIVGGVGAGYGKVALASEEGEVVVLSSEDGSELWRAKVSSEVSSIPQFNQDLAVFQLINGKIVAFEAATGKRLWTFDSLIPRLTLRGTSSPFVSSDVTFAGFSNGKLIAIDNAKGSALWETRVALPQGRSELERMVDIDGKPLIVDRMLYVTSYQGRLVAINPFRAQIVWSKDVSSYRSLTSGFGNIYVSESNDAVQAFDLATSASVWRQAALENRRVTSPVTVGSEVAVGDYEGYVHFMSQTDGHFVARYKVDSSGLNGDMLVSDNVLYVLGNSGRLSALSLK
ncbi:MAG: outer membrane protein assembly factor BamB [Neptuniibacter sp.]